MVKANDKQRAAIAALLRKGVKPDASIAERVGCHVSTVRAQRARMKREAER
jgi:DNA-binding CsgD family transcriptional regulator